MNQKFKQKGYQYFCATLSIYLAVYFISLGFERHSLFGLSGMMFYSPNPIKLDSVLGFFHQELFLIFILTLSTMFSFLFCFEKYRQSSSFFLVISILFIKWLNPYLYQVSWNYILWILWAHLIGFKEGKIPEYIYKYAWYLTGVALTLSGLSKALNTDHWMDGGAMRLFLQNPATMYHFSREFFIKVFEQFPILAVLMNWTVLLLEIFSFPLVLFNLGRKIFVIMYLLMFSTLMICTSLTFLEIGMIIWLLFLLNSFNFKLSFHLKDAV